MAERDPTKGKARFEPLAPPSEQFADGKARYFVAVGVSDPAPGSSLLPLRHVANDLETMRGAFSSLGYQSVELMPESEVSPLELTRDRFQERFGRWLNEAKLGPGDELAFYFSGHGYRSGLHHYLCFRDFDLQNPSKQGLTAEALVTPIIDRSPTVAGRVWILLDCCMAAEAAEALATTMHKAARLLGPEWSGRITAATGSINPSFDGCFSRTFAEAVNEGVRGAAAIERFMRESFGTANPQKVVGSPVGAWEDDPSFPLGHRPALLLLERAVPEPEQPTEEGSSLSWRRTVVWAVGLFAMVGAAWIGVEHHSNPLSLAEPNARPKAADKATASMATRAPTSASSTVRIPTGILRKGLTLPEATRAFALCQESYGKACHSWEASVFARSVRPEPSIPVQVAGFRLDRTEVSTAAFAAWMNARPRWQLSTQSPDLLVANDGRPWVKLPKSRLRYSQGAVFFQDADASLPATGMSFFAAERFCADQGARLPTEEEWEIAARGPAGRTYPWGEGPPLSCTQAVYDRRPFGVCARSVARPEPVDLPRDDVTPEGVQDLGGNVAEWTATRYQGAATDEICPPSAHCHVVRGGSFREGLLYLASGLRSRHPDDEPMPNGGLRCARD